MMHILGLQTSAVWMTLEISVLPTATRCMAPPFLRVFPTNSQVKRFMLTYLVNLIGIAGTRIRAWGTNAIRNDSGLVDPRWECFVDNVSVGAAPAFPYPENNWLICPETPLQDGTHTLTVKATVLRNQTFWFDRIEYVPSPNLSLANETILIHHSDPRLQFGTGWGRYGEFAMGTSQRGAVFVFNFYGM